MPWSIGNVGLFDGRVEANRDDLVAGSSAPDDPTHRRCIASEQLCQRIFNSHARWRQRLVALNEPTPGKKIASDHPTVLLSAAFRQRLV
jgi:hypothetical protein